MNGNPRNAMKLISIFVGLFLLAECFNNKLAEANHKSEVLRQILLEFQRDVSLRSKENTLTAKEWLVIANKKSLTLNQKTSVANWNYENNILPETQKKKDATEVEVSQGKLQLAQKAAWYLKQNQDFSLDSRRQLEFLKNNSNNPKDKNKVEEESAIQSKLTNIYASGQVKLGGKLLDLEPELTKLFATSRDYEVLKQAWKGWRDVTGKKMRKDYTKLVPLLNLGATDNGFSDAAQVWLTTDFGNPDKVEETMDRLWKQVKPLYQQLHAYVRYKLEKEAYPQMAGSDVIPAHVLGNMWAQEWPTLFDIVEPYKNVTEPNYDKALKDHLEKKLTDRHQTFSTEREKLFALAKEMFDIAEQYYMSIGLRQMTPKFWQNSVIIKPQHRKIVCHASAWDFHDGKDFRIKMCTEPTMEYFETIHHEMGHIQYFMAYSHQLPVYRRGANGGFHEAIGDTIALSVRTTSHLAKVFELPEVASIDAKTQYKLDINYLMRRALLKVAFLPFGYLIDKWRWRVFRGEITEKDYNYQWWKMRLKYQGLVPPVMRSEEDFDPGAKFHVASGVPYIRYFFSFIAQFQFLEAMCDAVEYKGPLHKCDLYGKKPAGERLDKMLELGASKPWPEAMKVITGQPEIKADSIMNFFKPLHNWLIDENKKLGIKAEWDENQEFLFKHN